jgi:hypothetical protein
MLVFWWVGKGYWTLLLLFLVGMAGTVILQAIGLGTEGPWFAAAVLAVAAGWNWTVGSRWNASSRARRPVVGLWPAELSHRRTPLPVDADGELLGSDGSGQPVAADPGHHGLSAQTARGWRGTPVGHSSAGRSQPPRSAAAA